MRATVVDGILDTRFDGFFTGGVIRNLKKTIDANKNSQKGQKHLLLGLLFARIRVALLYSALAY